MDKYVEIWYDYSKSKLIICYVKASIFGIAPGKALLEDETALNKIGQPRTWMIKFYVARTRGNKKIKITRGMVLHYHLFFNELYNLSERERFRLNSRKIDIHIILGMIDARRFIPSSLVVFNHKYFNKLLDGF